MHAADERVRLRGWLHFKLQQTKNKKKMYVRLFNKKVIFFLKKIKNFSLNKMKYLGTTYFKQ